MKIITKALFILITFNLYANPVPVQAFDYIKNEDGSGTLNLNVGEISFSNFEKFSPLLSAEQANEYLYASLSMKVWRYLSVDASIRKALTLTQTEGEKSSSSVD